MKNLLKFLLFVGLLSAGNFRALRLSPEAWRAEARRARHAGEIYLASAPSIEPKEVATLEALNRERRALVEQRACRRLSVSKHSKKVPMRRQDGFDPFEFFYRNPRQFRNPNEQAIGAKFARFRGHCFD